MCLFPSEISSYLSSVMSINSSLWYHKQGGISSPYNGDGLAWHSKTATWAVWGRLSEVICLSNLTGKTAKQNYSTVSFLNKFESIRKTFSKIWPIIHRVDRAFAAETEDLGSIPRRVKSNTIKIWCSLLPCLTFSIKKNSVKPPSCVVDKRVGYSFTRRPQGLFAVSWLRQIGE